MSNEQQRATERLLQASRQNSVEDSGPSGGRGGRESTSPASSPGNLTKRYWDWEGDWFECNGEWCDRATRESVFKRPFVARRIQDGRLDPEWAEKMWNHHVG
eukprot:CAMPEP_0172589070 /NCGR_PEP_ID=MMETSP1068-20121228/7886_1 /TAXON_ID=35684 /ORGANISM="Pseudopedinella elastica, Strain CCMP716" /LENGTH=101 /DNA_ID=CAMNT_0013384587 /DNA_START=193 /DNA_END=495 /DNA_ORIENTATION=+